MNTPSVRALTVTLCVLAILPASAFPAFARAEVPAPATGLIKGTLVDVNGQPLVGYIMRIIGPDGVIHASKPTGSDGRYEVQDLPPATYSYEILDQDGAKVPVRIPPIRLEAGMAVSQPIAIVPRSRGRGRGVAWAFGGAGLVVAAIAAASNSGKGDPPPMSPQ